MPDENAPAPADVDAPAPARTTPGRGIDPLASWRKHKGKALAVAGMVLLLGAPLVLLRGKPVYYAEAALRVAPSFGKNLQDDEELKLPSTTQYLQFVQQQVTNIRSYAVALDTLARLGPKRSLWQQEGESDRRAAERLMAALTVRPVLNTYLITVGLEGSDPAGLAEIVNTVTAAYLEVAGEETLFGTDDRIRSLEGQRGELQRQVDDRVEQLTKLAQDLGVSTFKEGELNPLDSALVGTGEALADWRRRRISAEAKLKALEEAQQREAALEVDSAARAVLDKNIAVHSATRLYHDRRDKLLSQASGLTEGHPGRDLIDEQLAANESDLKKVLDTELAATKAILDQQRKTAAAQEWSRAKAEADEARDAEEALAAQYATEQRQLAEYSRKYQEAIDLEHDIARARKRVEAINNRIDFLVVEQEAPGFVRIASPARTPETPTSGGRRLLALLIGAVALGAGLGLPILLDRFDPRIVVPGDLEKALGFAPMSWIVERSDKRTSSFADDQIQRFALALERERGGGTTCVALTGVARGAGTSTLTLALARELAALGVRALAIETDFVHADTRYQGDARSPGLAALLSGGARPDEAIVPANGALPDRLPVGYARGEAHLASPQRLRALLEELRRSYDLLLVDAPPVLASAEGELVMQTAEVALLVVRAGALTPGDVKRAAKILERLAPPAVGAVLNRVQVYDQGRSFTKLMREQERADGVATRAPFFRWLWT